MKKAYPDLDKEQWRFLAVLEAFGDAVPIDILDVLAPLTPGRLFDLLKKTKSGGMLRQLKDERFDLGSPLPHPVAKKIDALNGRKHLSELLHTLYAKKLDKQVDPHVLIRLLERSGRAAEAVRMEYSLVDAELAKGDIESAQKYLLSAVHRLKTRELDAETCGMFITRALRLSHIRFVLGREIRELSEILITARTFAARLGDKRSHALATLHLGRLYQFMGRYGKALSTLSDGLNDVNELGDEDILAQSAEFLGLYYSLKGLFKEAMKHMERFENLIGISEEPTPPMTYIVFSYGALYLGQFHRAIGFLDSNLRLAEEKGDRSLAPVLRGILGTTLTLLKRFHEAEFHLKKARKESIDIHNAFGYHFSGGGLALLYFMRGDLEKSYEILSETIEKAIDEGLIHQYAAPWILEMAFEFNRLGFKPIRGFPIADVLEVALNGVNVHLRGVGLRLKSIQKMDRGDADTASIRADLEESRACLDTSGDRIQQAKTTLEMAHLELMDDNASAVDECVREAWRLFGGYSRDLFPDKYKALLKKIPSADTSYSRGDFIGRYFEEMDTIKSSMDQLEILNKMLRSTNRFFGAERGGLFWFSKGKFTKKPELKLSSNLAKEDVESPLFRPYLELIARAFRTNKPLVVRDIPPDDKKPGRGRIRSVLCIPVEVQGMTRCVMYYDNSYLPDAFDCLDPSTIAILGRHTSGVIEFLLKGSRIQEEKEKLSREKKTGSSDFKSWRIVGRSKAIREQLAMARQVARADTTVLMLGETGTGKGLLARLIHEKGGRAEGPFIVVDCTTIPENLFESELFGYEKGAFTGADRQKLGRVELAHEGTLFLDEIGELPLNVQTKLLKTLEEKTFVRIGGGRAIKSDFRLIVATNRNLKSEVSSGRFREDLFYRINVFPITMPPLRERGEDIVELAHHYFERYRREYGRSDLKLLRKEEAKLLKYAWPGNVRELQNVIERAVILSAGGELQIPLFPEDYHANTGGLADDKPTMDELQRRYIRHILDYTKGRVGGPGGAAEILKMKRTTLYSRMKALGIKK